VDGRGVGQVGVRSVVATSGRWVRPGLGVVQRPGAGARAAGAWGGAVWAEIGRELLEADDSTRGAQRLADDVRALVEAKSVVLFRRDPESGSLTSIAVSGDIGPLDGPSIVLPPGVGPSGLAVRERRPVWTPDVLTDR